MSLGKTEVLRSIGGWRGVYLDVLRDLENEQTATKFNCCYDEDYKYVSDSIVDCEPDNSHYY
jgi:hypothetical protein